MKKKFCKRLIISALCTCFITTILPIDIIPVIAENDTEEKRCCTATLEDNFIDNKVTVILP